MSIERVSRKHGVVWRVRWRDSDRNRARTFDRKADATAFEAEVRRRKRVEDLASLDAGRETLQEFAEEWWQLHALLNLAPATLANYATLWDAHVLPRLGALRLRDLNPEVIARFRADLTRSGVGDASVRKFSRSSKAHCNTPSSGEGSPSIRAARCASRRNAERGSFIRFRPSRWS